jgi:RNA polymerase sigma-70 factor (ECF subfamily)
MIKSYDLASDEEIIKEVLNGNIQSFRYIVQRYENKIFSIGIRFTKNEDDARDFTQNLFLNIFRKLDKFKGSAPFKHWMVKIAYNMAIDSSRGSRETQELNENIVFSKYPDHESSHFRNEIKKILNDAVSELPDNYKVCIDLYFYWGMSYENISEITDMPVNTIKSNVLRAKKMIHSMLKGTIAEDYNEM